jgi:hypothetical protein
MAAGAACDEQDVPETGPRGVWGRLGVGFVA